MKKTAAATVLASLLLAGCTTVATTPSGAENLKLTRYVAMGSSMAAGPGLGELKPGTPARCTRTFANYPTLLAEKLRLTLVDATCSGATTDHLLEPWKELPAQIDAVTADTRLVTITIGGNDLNYVGGLIAASCGESGKMTIGSRTFDCPQKTRPSESDYAKVETNLREIVRQVKARAPQAEVVFVEYLRLVPDTLCEDTPISEEDAAAARQIADRLAAITQRVAREGGAGLVPAHRWSAQNTACDASPYTIGAPTDLDVTAGNGVHWHPNRAGMAQVAAWVEYVLGE